MDGFPLMAHGFANSPVITGAGAACGLGVTAARCRETLASKRAAPRPIRELLPNAGDGLAAWIEPRGWLHKKRRYAPATQAALHVADEALDEAGWTDDERHGAWIFAGSSRGNVGELAGQRAERRAARKFAASNSLHSEIAAATGIELGIRGPWQMFSNGCAASLDALGWAALAISLGWTRRALVLAADLPLVPALLDDFRATGLLGSSSSNDPYAPETDGFHPGEAAAAIALESPDAALGKPALARVGAYVCGSDAHHVVGLPEDGAPMAACIARAITMCGGPDAVTAICPHATGTADHRRSESASLISAFPDHRPSLHLLKPFTGHSLGASGLLDVALLCGWLKDHILPPNLPGLTPPAAGWDLPNLPRSINPGQCLLKLAAGMGGHNAVVSLSPP